MNTLITIIAALSMYLIPYLTGRLVLQKWGKTQDTLSSFSVGALLMFGLILIGNTIFTGMRIPVDAQALRAIGIIGVTGLILANLDLFRQKISLDKSVVPIVLAVILASLIWYVNIPYPNTVNWDLFEHQTLINTVLTGRIAFQTSHITDTFGFDGYSSIFHMLLAIPQFLFRPDVLGFWWIGQILHFVLTVWATYTLAFAVSKNRTVSSIAAVISAFIFESYSVFSSFFLLPQTLAGLAFAIVLAQLLSEERHVRAVELAPTILFLALTHYIMGGAALLLVGGFLIIRKWSLAHHEKFLHASLLILYGIFALLTALAMSIPLSFINGGEAASFTYPLAKKIEFFRVFYGGSFFILFPIGVYTALNTTLTRHRIVTVLSLIILIVLASPIPYAIKFYALGRYLTHVVMAIGAWAILRHLKPSLQYLSIFGLTILFAAQLSLNAGYWKRDVLYRNSATQVSGYEMEAAGFLTAHYLRKNTLLVSDPATQNVLEALSGVNSAGGVYMKTPMRKLAFSVINARTKETGLRALTQITDGVETTKPATYLVALSGRTYAWAGASAENRDSLGFAIWTPQDLSLISEGSILNFPLGTLVYKNPGVAIFEVTL